MNLFLVRICLSLQIIIISVFITAQKQNPDNFNNKTPVYDEIINTYQLLDKQYNIAKLIEAGETDIGKPLHVFIISKEKDFDPSSNHKKDKRIVFINNGIHPGESCGIDASIQFSKDLLSGKLKQDELLENTTICIFSNHIFKVENKITVALIRPDVTASMPG